jgi:hypothetical protein
MDVNWTTVLTIAGSFGAASTAQIISHLLTQRREEKKYNKECFQKLYSPIIFKINDYLFCEGLNTSFKDKSLAFDTEKLFNEISDKIGENLMYANTELILEYEELQSFSTYDIDQDEDKELVMLQRIRMCGVFISQYMNLSKDLNTLSESVNDKLKGTYFFTQFYLLVSDCVPWLSIESSTLFKYFDLIEAIMHPKNHFLERILNIRENPSLLRNTREYRDKILSEETNSEALGLLYEIFDEFELLSKDDAEFWRTLLEKEYLRFKK